MARWSVIVLIAIYFTSLLLIKVQALYQGSKLDVRKGTHDCISDCSPMSSSVSCALTECQNIPETGDGSEKADIEKVSFEIFKNEVSGKNELALNVKWSPEDFGTVDRVVGYMIEIGDGATSYSKCYNFGEKLDFSRNIHDVHYNDCFGKANGTEVILGSFITVSVITLPINSGDPNESRRNFTVTVPDCSHEKFLDLSQCAEERRMRQDCSSNCSTFSTGTDNVTHPILCSISTDTIHRISPDFIVQCPEIKQNATDPGPAPQWLKIDWYKYRDHQSGNIKLALNISWGLDSDQLASLAGFDIGAFLPSTSSTKCLSIDTQLEKDKHSKATFFYDCFGRDNELPVEPNSEYWVDVASLPASDSGSNHANIQTKIPSCTDPRMVDITACKKETNTSYGKVEEIFCAESLFQFSYNISPRYGTKVNIVLYKEEKVLSRTTSKNLSGKVNISFPQPVNFSSEYSVYVAGNMEPVRFTDSVKFSNCNNPSIIDRSIPSSMVVMVVIVIVILAVVAMISFAGVVFWRWQSKDNTQNQSTKYKKANTSNKNASSVPSVKLTPGEIRIFVIYESDHQLHKNVIAHFCSVLKKDFCLDVHIAFWEKEKLAQNRSNYVWKNLEESDKVVLVCSAGTRQGFNVYYQPVMDRIFQATEPEKYVAVYFDYSSLEDVPQVLRNSTTEVFKLLQQFELFGFRLMGEEKYQDTIRTFNKIPSEENESNTASAKDLLFSIEKMRQFVSDSPTWYNDTNGEEMASSDLNGFHLPSNGIHEHQTLMTSEV